MGQLRRNLLTKPIFTRAKAAMPSLSETESEALHAGETWWDAELFSGHPDWEKLLAVDAPSLTEDERAFLDGPCAELCAMLNDWQINQQDADLPEEAWAFMREKGFFGMIIPQAYGGLGFSAYAHSEVVRLVSTCSVAAAVTVMVPNSLGPGELLLLFGTDSQKDYWLPRLAHGHEVPAFGLSSNQAGSDASAMVDDGVICRGNWQGEEVLGIRLNWSKRYITLAPICTLLGLAFKLRDPDHLLGDDAEIGITCALVPTQLQGVEIGRRHIPSSTMFQNGPTSGTNVFIPLENIIGGADYAGRGWMMLMRALASGRGISLPSLSCAGSALAAHTTGAYARIRHQFNVPIGKFGGVQEPMARLAANVYAADAARRLTCSALDEGRSLAVLSAVMKYTTTERLRRAINDAMDVHAGKTVIDGPSNYLSPLYKALPIGITVEGANIVTRSLMIFGQGAVRAHPHMLNEMLALQEDDDETALDNFDTHFWPHVGHSFRTFFRALGRAWSGAMFAPAPHAGKARPIYRRLGRWSAAYALTADMALLTIGGDLKKKEMLAGRMSDILCEMYFLSAVLKRWEDEGRKPEDYPLVAYNADQAFSRISTSLDEVLTNFPSRVAAGLLRFATLPGDRVRGPNDHLTELCADLIYEPSAARERLVGKFAAPACHPGVAPLTEAYDQVLQTESLTKKLRDLGKTPTQAVEEGLITETEQVRLDAAQAAMEQVIGVDDYSPDQLAQLFPGLQTESQEEELKEARQ